MSIDAAACGPVIEQFDKVALPAIIDYKFTEVRCEKLPRLLPSLFSEVPEPEQLRRYDVLHQKWKQSLFDLFMELGGVPHRLRPHALHTYGTCARRSRARHSRS